MVSSIYSYMGNYIREAVSLAPKGIALFGVAETIKGPPKHLKEISQKGL